MRRVSRTLVQLTLLTMATRVTTGLVKAITIAGWSAKSYRKVTIGTIDV